MSIHGADQSRAHAEAAKRLSEAKARLFAAEERDTSDWAYTTSLDLAEREYAAAKADEYVARQAYTNPFGIEKTS
ncbi:hypothetical protein SEA_CECE_289 [Microbacterium phage Cece]|nr:hypothetical protein SEA_CECE_289 [Microbacterium phage Cece]